MCKDSKRVIVIISFIGIKEILVAKFARQSTMWDAPKVN